MAKAKILKTGETNINSTDIWRFVLHSDYPTSKIFANSSASVTILTGNQGIEGQTAGNPPIAKQIYHGLGYIPMCRVTVNRTSTSFSGTRYFSVKGSQTYFDETDVLGRVFSATADINYLNLYLFNTVDAQPSNRSWTFNYIIQYDEV